MKTPLALSALLVAVALIPAATATATDAPDASADDICVRTKEFVYRVGPVTSGEVPAMTVCIPLPADTTTASTDSGERAALIGIGEGCIFINGFTLYVGPIEYTTQRNAICAA